VNFQSSSQEMAIDSLPLDAIGAVRRSRSDGAAPDEVEADLKAQLVTLSNDFVDVPGAINLFRRAFPEGCGSRFYRHYERDYKAKTAIYIQEVLPRSDCGSWLMLEKARK
jgi:hypothetical protein